MLIQQGLFPILANDFPIQILNLKEQASCKLFMRKSKPIDSKLIILQAQQYQDHQIILMTSGQYVFQLDSQNKKVKSGFKCDFDIKFWMVRTQSMVPNTVGKVEGIAFQFCNETQNKNVTLFLPEQCQQEQLKSLQNFTSVLQKKYIVQRQFHQKYKAIKRIGKGVTACVYSSLCLIDKSQVAIKSFKKDIYFNQDNGNGRKGFLKQFKILTQLKCKYLSKLYGVYQSDHSIYIVQELLSRTLHNYLQKFGFPQFTQSRKLLYQLLIGLRFLHRKNIMHRDLKLQNILVRGDGKDNIQPVIVDFGLAQYQNTKDFVYIRCGTPGYVAPQVINISKEEKSQIRYNKSCDIFSLGVIFHIFLLGRTVFQGQDIRQVVQRNKICNIDYEFKYYPRIMPQVKDLLIGMLNRHAQKRYTVEQLMDHQFFKQQKLQFFKQVYYLDNQNQQKPQKNEEQIKMNQE